MEAVRKTLPFFSQEEEKEEQQELKTERQAIQENIRDLRQELSVEEEIEDRERAAKERQIQSLRKIAVENLSKENLLDAILIRKNAAEKGFLRKINYAYDFQKKDIENYYREKRKVMENVAENTGADEERPEDEDR